MFPLLRACQYVPPVGTGKQLTQVIQAPLSAPKAISHAGSSDWKYSSGWKNVLILSALSIRNAIRNSKMSWAVAASCARSKARRRYDFSACWESIVLVNSSPLVVDASNAGVVDVDIGLCGSDREGMTKKYVTSKAQSALFDLLSG